jgi:hypothetical protein
MPLTLSRDDGKQALASLRRFSDAQVFLRDRLADLEAACYEAEFAYWPKGTSVRRK